MIDFTKPPWSTPPSTGGGHAKNRGGQAKRVVIDGRVFNSPQAAAAHFSVTDTAIRNAVKRGRWRGMDVRVLEAGEDP